MPYPSSNSTPDDALLLRFQQGDAATMHHLYERYMPELCFFAENLTGDTQVAEDIATESFIAAIRRRTAFISLEKLQGFLFTVARNAARDHLKQRARHSQIHADLGRATEATAEDPELIYLRAEARQLIYEQIEQLPAQCAEVVRRFVIEGQSVEVIATDLQIAYKTVMNQKSKGLALVRAALLKNKLLSVPLLLAALSFLRD